MQLVRGERPRILSVAQWGVLALISAALVTHAWYTDWVVPAGLLTLAGVIWASELREGVRRWWFVYVAGIALFSALRAVADDTGFSMHAAYAATADRVLFGGTDPVIWLQSRAFAQGSMSGIGWLATQTHWSFFIMPHVVAAIVYVKRPQLFARYTLLQLVVLYGGLICFFLLPTTPPWLAADYGTLAAAERVLDVVGGTIDLQVYDAMYQALGEPNVVAAMPSLHMAVTFAVTLWVWRHARGFGWLFAVYSAWMAVSLVLLAEHFVVDLLAGVALAIAADTLVERVATRRRSAGSEPKAAPLTEPDRARAELPLGAGKR
jgi:hypothetical protein